MDYSKTLFFGKSIGFYSIIYIILGILSGKFGKGFSKENKTTIVSMVACGTIIFEILIIILGQLIYNYDINLLSFGINTFKKIIYNIIISFIIYKPLLFLGDEIINKAKNSYYLL